MNKDIAEVGDLIRIVDPVWDWLKEGDIGVIVKRKKWAGLEENGTKTADRYNYRVRFATNNQTRVINRREFEIISTTKV
jgi:hypothetical protein